MSNTSLRTFVSKALASKRIGFGDLRRLQRDILPSGIATREEAEALVGLDRAIEKADQAWPGYLATAVKDFVLSRSASPGCVDQETAAWLVAMLSGSRTRTAQAITREIVLEAQEVDEALLASTENPKRKGRPARLPPAPPRCDQDDVWEDRQDLARALAWPSRSYPWHPLPVSWCEVAVAHGRTAAVAGEGRPPEA